MAKTKKKMSTKKPKENDYLLESGTLSQLREAKAKMSEHLAYHFEHFQDLQYQRSLVMEKIKEVLNSAATKDFEFESYQRAVRWKYSQHPLCALGSLADPGGRFNVGNIDAYKFSTFSALYMAKDKNTAMQESLCQSNKSSNGFSNSELALSKSDSITIVSVSGKVERVLDLRKPDVLKPFVKIISNFKFSENIKSKAKVLGISEPKCVTTASQLMKTLLDPNWRDNPMRWDIPSNSQIFGGLAFQADLGGIVYPSKFTKDPCLAVFTKKIDDSMSEIIFDDEPPNEVVPRKINKTNWHKCELDYERLSKIFSMN